MDCHQWPAEHCHLHYLSALCCPCLAGLLETFGTTPCAEAITFPNINGFLVCCPALAPGVGCEVAPEFKEGLETHFPLLTNSLDKWVKISVDGMLPLGGVLLQLGGVMDNRE